MNVLVEVLSSTLFFSRNLGNLPSLVGNIIVVLFVDNIRGSDEEGTFTTKPIAERIRTVAMLSSVIITQSKAGNDGLLHFLVLILFWLRWK
jgi:hypothetical protein